MDKHSGTRARCQCIIFASLCGVAMPALGEVVLTTEFYSAITHQRQGDESDNGLQLGNTTSLGYRYATGPHRYTSGYSINRRRLYYTNENASAIYTGTAGYTYTPNRIVDANLGHSVRAAGTDESLLADFSDYDLRHSLTAGAGVNLLPGSRTRTRFELQGTQALDRGLNRQGHQATARVINSLQVSRTASASLTAGRALQWDADNTLASTTDSLQLGYQRALANGGASASVGVSLYEAGNNERTLITAGLNRTWVTGTGRVNLGYNRAISDTLTELSREIFVFDPDNPPESEDDLETETEVIQLQQATLADTISFSYLSQSLCDRCEYQYNSTFTTQDVLFGGSRNYVYSIGASLNVQASSVQTVTAQYNWRATANTLVDGPDRQQHRVNLGLNRQLARKIQGRASLEHGWENKTDNRSTTARLGVRIGLIN